jgi:predicted nucleic acid-binding protein
MIVLDTNVVSELMRISPSLEVMDWWKGRLFSELFITTVTEAEVLLGIELLPKGKRRTGLESAAKTTFEEDFEGHILPFDSDAAREFARIVAARRELGRPMSQADAQIAAIARSRGAAVATRNTEDFEGCGIRIVNPWHGH